MNQVELKHYFAAYTATPPRTRALELRIGIGSHCPKTWHRSQRECWLGWLVAKDCEALGRGEDPAQIDAQVRWQHLLSSPLMFWVAECAGMPASVLDRAEQAAINATAENPKSGHPHGVMMREVLPWEDDQQAIENGPAPLPAGRAEAMALEAFNRLCAKRGEFRRLREYLPSTLGAQRRLHV